MDNAKFNTNYSTAIPSANQLRSQQNTSTPPRGINQLPPSNFITNSVNYNSNLNKYPPSQRKGPYEDGRPSQQNYSNYGTNNTNQIINGRSSSIGERDNLQTNDQSGHIYKGYPSAAASQSFISASPGIRKIEKEQEGFMRLSLENINRELDLNINEIIMLLNKRKQLIIAKRQKLRQDYLEQIDLIKRLSLEELTKDPVGSEDGVLQKIVNSTNSYSKMKKVVQRVTQDMSFSQQERQKVETKRAADFWSTNKVLEDEVDSHLQKLKYFDSELEKSNSQIQEVCKNLDSLDEQIKILLLTKDQDHLKRAEPAFQQKQRLHDQLNLQNGQRNNIKDQKINLIMNIIHLLSNLKQLRQDRLQDLLEVFGIEDNQADSTQKIQYYIDFVDQLENLAKIKDFLDQADLKEEGLQIQIDKIFKENDQLFEELIKKQSEEAKVYSDLADNLTQKISFQKAILIFSQSANIKGQLDVRDLLKKFKDNLSFLKPLVEEDVALRQGLNKTFETISAFSNSLLAIETEKERRKELVARLEQCIRLKGEGDQKTEDLRNVEMEITKRFQQKKNLEEDLDHILSDADLEEYKKLGIQMKSIDKDSDDLNKRRARLTSEVDQIEQQVVVRINQIRNDYDDIIKEVISNDIINNYDFKSANDIKAVKNLLKKTFKRLGMTFEDQRNY